MGSSFVKEREAGITKRPVLRAVPFFCRLAIPAKRADKEDSTTDTKVFENSFIRISIVPQNYLDDFYFIED